MTTAIKSLDVVVLSYNFDKFLPDALAGVAAQTRQPETWLVSDDCSPDSTAEALEALIAPWAAATLVRNPTNMGPVAHFRHRVQALTGDAYALLSGDDYLVDPNFFADATAILEANPDINAVFGHHLSVDQDGRVTGAERPAAPTAWTRLNGATLRIQLAYENVVPAVGMVVRRSIHDKLPPFPLDSPTRHDWQQWYLMTYHGDFARLERTVVHYRMHGDNISVGPAQAQRMAATVEAAYDQLMQRPECTDVDRRHLRAGLNRIHIRSAGIRQLPGVLSRNRRVPGVALAVAETLAERASRNLTHVATKLRRRFLERHTGGHW